MTGKKCPLCGREMEVSPDNEFYYMCHWCIVGWTAEELNGIRRYLELMERKQK